MERITISRKGWVVVCDGGRALVLRNDGSAAAPDLQPVDVTTQTVPPTRDLGTDRPGRTHAAHGPGRSAVEQTDWHDAAEAAFLADLAAQLDRSVTAHAVEHMVLVAAPRALGVLRKHLSPAVAGIVSAEIAKDLAGLPIPEITKYFGA